MPLDQTLLTIVGVVLAYMWIATRIPFPMRSQRRALQPERVQPGLPGGIGMHVASMAASAPSREPVVLSSDDPGDHETARAAVEAFMAELAADGPDWAAPADPDPDLPEVISRRLQAVMSLAPTTAESAPPWATPDDPDDADDGTRSTIPAHAWGLQARGTPRLADPATWDRSIRAESARVARFGRPVTVVVAELPHLDDVVSRLGPDVADRVVMETARLLVSAGRSVDRITWLGGARFGILLFETEEARARSYVGRVRAAADGWLQSAGLSIRLSVAWAGPAEDGDVMAALAIAEQRICEASGRSSAN